MQKSRLINYLKKLSKREFLEFGEYIRTPFFNKNKKVIELYDHIAPFYKEFQSDKLNKTHVFQVLFPKHKYNTPKINDIINKLKALLDDYLTFLGVKSNPIDANLLRLRVLKDRNIEEFIPSVVKKIEKQLAAFPLKDMDYYRYEVQLNYTLHKLYSNQRFKKGLIHLQNTMDNLDLYYCATKLRVNYDILTAERTFKKSLNVYQFEEVRSLLNLHNDENPLFKIYLLINQLNKYPNLETYLSLRKLVLENINKAKEEEQVAWFITLINYVIRNSILTADFDSIKEKVNLYKFGLQKGYLLEEGIIVHRLFLNMLIAASTINDHAWIKEIQENYIIHLKKEFQENMKKLCIIYYLYSKKELKEALAFFKDNTINDYMEGVGIRILKIRICYELEKKHDGYMDLLDNNILAFKRFLQRHQKISSGMKKSYLAFLRFTELIIRSQSTFQKKVIKQDLLDKLSDQKRIAGRYWLTKMIEQM